MSYGGSYKLPESTIFNRGLSSTTSAMHYFDMPDVPWVKNQFDTRI
ncbi:MAG: hypothetical protein Nk1A_8520 [Endomicrobiia bacterium]|nr:MAG: hypothetical protein Nk1A_8520 [Endomicrobiia bacterium]